MKSTTAEEGSTVTDAFINNGMVARIAVTHCMHPLNTIECDVYRTLTATPDCSVVVMPNHCVSAGGSAEGFKFTCLGSDSATVLPVDRQMFFRHSMVECILPTDANDGEHIEILDMIINRANVLQKLTTLVQRITVQSENKQVTFDCMPENVDMVHGGVDPSYNVCLTADGRDWMPEPPQMVGIFHAYVKKFNNDLRTHKMYIVCSGGCSSISDKYYNLHTDVKHQITCAEFLNSEESWYLKEVNKRNNARVMQLVAEELGLCIPTKLDQNAYESNREIAATTTETIYKSIAHGENDTIMVYNQCCDTRVSNNGLLCTQHPSDGIQLFKGTSKA